MRDFLEFLVKSIAAKPEKVVIDEQESEERGLVLTINTHPEDIGLIIGKGGKVIKSLRHLVRAKSILEKKRVAVEINAPERPSSV